MISSQIGTYTCVYFPPKIRLKLMKKRKKREIKRTWLRVETFDIMGKYGSIQYRSTQTKCPVTHITMHYKSGFENQRST